MGDIFLSPVLGRENQDDSADATGKHLYKGVDLAGKVNAGHRLISQGAHHQVVRKGGEEGNQALGCHRQGKGDQAFIIGSVPGQNMHQQWTSFLRVAPEADSSLRVLLKQTHLSKLLLKQTHLL